MRSTDKISVGAGEIDPDGVVTSQELRLRYQSSDEDWPRQVILFTLHGTLSIDNEARVGLRRVFSEDETRLLVREADVKLAGPIWFDVAMWLADESGGMLFGAMVAGGLKKIVKKIKNRSDDPPAMFAPPLPTSISNSELQKYLENLLIHKVREAYGSGLNDLTVESIDWKSEGEETRITAVVNDVSGASFTVEQFREADHDLTVLNRNHDSETPRNPTHDAGE